MDGKELARYGQSLLQKAGAQKASCTVTTSQQHELTADAGRISLLRTTFESSIGMVAIRDHRRGVGAGNKTTPDAVERLAEETMAVAAASQPDEAYDIADYQEPASFTWGAARPDRDLMVHRFQEFLGTVKTLHPTIVMDQAILRFVQTQTHVLNTNDVDFTVVKGMYGFSAMFTAKDGRKTSSFNGSSFVTRGLERDLLSYGSLGRLLAETAEQTDCTPLAGRFVGDLILTPDAFADFLGSYVGAFLSDGALISGTSLLKDRLDCAVASGCLTVHDHPRSPELEDHTFLTPDGFLARNHTIIDHGVLKTFLLSLYGSRKTGRPRAANLGSACIVEPGESSLKDLIGTVERGIVLGRFSGGYPGESGEFSGVAKNSYYVEGGRVRYPVTQTMISSNLIDLFANARAVSTERVDSGASILPWVCCGGVTISGQ